MRGEQPAATRREAHVAEAARHLQRALMAGSGAERQRHTRAAEALLEEAELIAAQEELAASLPAHAFLLPSAPALRRAPDPAQHPASEPPPAPAPRRGPAALAARPCTSPPRQCRAGEGRGEGGLPGQWGQLSMRSNATLQQPESSFSVSAATVQPPSPLRHRPPHHPALPAPQPLPQQPQQQHAQRCPPGGSSFRLQVAPAPRPAPLQPPPAPAEARPPAPYYTEVDASHSHPLGGGRTMVDPSAAPARAAASHSSPPAPPQRWPGASPCSQCSSPQGAQRGASPQSALAHQLRSGSAGGGVDTALGEALRVLSGPAPSYAVHPPPQRPPPSMAHWAAAPCSGPALPPPQRPPPQRPAPAPLPSPVHSGGDGLGEVAAALHEALAALERHRACCGTPSQQPAPRQEPAPRYDPPPRAAEPSVRERQPRTERRREPARLVEFRAPSGDTVRFAYEYRGSLAEYLLESGGTEWLHVGDATELSYVAATRTLADQAGAGGVLPADGLQQLLIRIATLADAAGVPHNIHIAGPVEAESEGSSQGPAGRSKVHEVPIRRVSTGLSWTAVPAQRLPSQRI
eukprot:TRINITY_DN28723_c0_g2_i3.p2 TRINITY_DN28723_c0_g2~~TRINITY_DN28723_c0_g2_i3.p2  ORF type:complete len:597 (+),score=131.33 TRINITY_DN28723_c0_g2_i3:69-1793(+)